MPEVIVSADISFRHSGITKLTYTSTVKKLEVCELGTILAIDSLASQVKSVPDVKRIIKNNVGPVCYDYNLEPSIFLFEEPPPNGWYSAALTFLDGSLASDMLNGGWSVYSCSPRLITSFLDVPKGKSKGKKGVKFLKLYMQGDLMLLGLNISKLSSEDIADSLIFLMCFVYHMGWGETLFPSFKEHLKRKKVSKSGKITFTDKKYNFVRF